MSLRRRVLQVSTSDIGGGAEKVALDLHRAYLARGVDAHLAVGRKHTDEPGVVEIPNEARRGGWARTLTAAAERVSGAHPVGLRRLVGRGLLLAADPLRYGAIAQGVEDFDYPGTRGVLDLAGPRPDVLHLHNIHGYYFDLRRLPEISATQPTIITMHDPWLLTGHCAHPIDCERWRVGCGDCPDLARYVPIRKDASSRNYLIKRDALERSSVHLAAPSAWLARMAEESGVGGFGQVRVIPNGVDTNIFTPGDRGQSRAELGLPRDAEIVLFAAHGVTTNPFKDFATLVSAMRLVAARRPGKLALVVLGDAGAASEGLDVIAVPFSPDAETVALYYRAADLYVHAARAENLPLAVIEAMACGTPVVASAVGGIPEIVIDGETGLLVPAVDPVALAEAVDVALGDAGRREAFAQAGIARVHERFTLHRQVDAYLNWYAELTEGPRP